MVVDEDVDRIFQALADSTRRDILRRTSKAPESVSGLAARYAMSFAAVQKHVSVLERAELVTKERHGREQHVRAQVATVRTAMSLLEEYEQIWRDRAVAIEKLLMEDA